MVFGGETEIGPVTGFVWKMAGAFDRGLQPYEFTLEVPVAADRLFATDRDQFLHEDRPITEGTGTFPMPQLSGSM